MGEDLAPDVHGRAVPWPGRALARHPGQAHVRRGRSVHLLDAAPPGEGGRPRRVRPARSPPGGTHLLAGRCGRPASSPASPSRSCRRAASRRTTARSWKAATRSWSDDRGSSCSIRTTARAATGCGSSSSAGSGESSSRSWRPARIASNPECSAAGSAPSARARHIRLRLGTGERGDVLFPTEAEAERARADQEHGRAEQESARADPGARPRRSRNARAPNRSICTRAEQESARAQHAEAEARPPPGPRSSGSRAVGSDQAPDAPDACRASPGSPERHRARRQHAARPRGAPCSAGRRKYGTVIKRWCSRWKLTRCGATRSRSSGPAIVVRVLRPERIGRRLQARVLGDGERTRMTTPKVSR